MKPLKAKTLGYLSAAPRVSTRPDAEAGGPRSHVLGVMQAFEAVGYEVKPFIIGDRVPSNWVTAGSEHTISSSGLRRLLADGMRLGMGMLNARLAWRKLGNQVDWVYERHAAFQSLGWIFKRRGIPWILETNAPLFYESKNERKTMMLSALARRLEQRAYQKCDVLVCISEPLREIIIQEMNIPTEKIIVMPNGVDTAFFHPEQHSPKRIFKGFTVGFTGKLIDWQGIDSLLEATHDLRADGLDLNLVLVGDGPARASLETKAKILGLKDRVEFVGRVSRDKVPSYIAGFDVGYTGHVQSKVGAMYLSPLKLYEYMAMSKPTIASDFDDARQAVHDGETGFLFQATNKDDLKRALLKAYQARNTLAQMGYRAREQVVKHHSWKKRVTSLIEQVERLMANTETK